MSCWETATSAPDRTPPRRIGLLGGSFDPVHLGHLHLARAALQDLALDEVRLLPARPWQRRTVATDAQRLAMVQAACGPVPGLGADDTELSRTGPSYTVETLEALRDRLPGGTELWWLLGADAFLGLPTWHRWQDLARLCHLAVLARPGSTLAVAPDSPLAGWWARQVPAATVRTGAAPAPAPAHLTGQLAILTVPPLDISATAVRARLQRGEDAGDLLPPGVLTYIQNERPYPQEGHEP